MNHLLKAPFCIHPETRKVCVPINLELADDFNPNQVPKLESLIQELNGVQKLHRASYNHYVDIFRKFKEKLLNPEQTL
jgi:DNA primase small subunit